MSSPASHTPRSPRARTVGAVSLLTALGVGACAQSDDSAFVGESVGVHREALTESDCGFSVSATVTKANKKGFRAWVKVQRTDGGRLDTSGLTVLVNAGDAELVKVGHGTFEEVENGYLLSTIDRSAHRGDCDDEDSPEDDADVLAGRAYRFRLTFKGAPGELTANIISSDGVACDQSAPQVSLSASGDFFTSDDSLALAATATDDVAVSKIVFARDGVEIATVTNAPYSVTEPITAALNGRHVYTATAYDLTGNQASESSRVLVAIGNKFFGTAATDAADYADLLSYFDQVTPGNAGKWGSVEATRDVMDFTDLDIAYDFAVQNDIPFKLHTLVWGQQQPGWLAALPAEEQLVELDQWMAALAQRYGKIDIIDVVNEPLHAPPSYAPALGGAGDTGWDWVVTAFEMAREHFPNSELVLNDYSVLLMASTTQQYLEIVNVLDDRGLIDGIGEQGHFYERAPELSVLSSNLDALTATGLPLYISELDVNFADDARQANRMKDLFPIFWSNPSVLGVTHWGYRQGSMWQTNAYLVRTDGTARPALDFIECFKAGGTDCPVPEYIPQPRTGDSAAIALEAEDYDAAEGLLPAGNVVAYANDGSWFSFDKVVFDDNWDSLSVSYAQGGSSTVNLVIRLDSLDTEPVAIVPLAPTGDWSTLQTVSIPWSPIGAQRDVFVEFQGGAGNVDKLTFSAPTGAGQNIVGDGDFELGGTAGFWSWAEGTIENTTARAVSGTHSIVMTERPDNSPLVQSLTSMVVPGKTYQIDLWATVGGVPDASAWVTTAIKCVDGDTAYGRLGGWENVQNISDGDWVDFAGELAVPDCALENVAFWLEGPGAGVDLYIDHASVRQQTSANIVPNGTFESGTGGWYSWNGGVVSQTTERAHGGSASLLVGDRTQNAPAAMDLLSLVTPGNNYPFSLWVSVHTEDASSASINVTQATGCEGASTSYDWVGGPVAIPGGDDWAWVEISGTIAVPDCTLTQLQFVVEGGVGADLYVDDVQILDQSGGSQNLIPDGTFESGQGGWFGWGFTSLSTTTVSAHDGTQSLLGEGLQSNAALARDILSFVEPGKRYQAMAWVSVGNLEAGSGAVKFQTVQRCNEADSDSYPWLAGDTVDNGDWKQLTGVVDLSACTSVENLLLFVGADAGDLYVDDVTLTPLP